MWRKKNNLLTCKREMEKDSFYKGNKSDRILKEVIRITQIWEGK